MEMKLILVYEIYSLVLAVLAGYYARKKNRSPLFWGGLTGILLITTPFIYRLPGFYDVLLHLYEKVGSECRVICFFPWGFLLTITALTFAHPLCPVCNKPVKEGRGRHVHS
ncbi:MAG: hypothetical protein D6713_03945 [Deltaproteobacteria bacterium]|nr:MAG: hypothetical protein D6713_03945 [Deltaproteobacteria bacterium]